MEPVQRLRQTTRLIDCLCGHRHQMEVGTGMIRSVILVFAIGTAILICEPKPDFVFGEAKVGTSFDQLFAF